MYFILYYIYIITQGIVLPTDTSPTNYYLLTKLVLPTDTSPTNYYLLTKLVLPTDFLTSVSELTVATNSFVMVNSILLLRYWRWLTNVSHWSLTRWTKGSRNTITSGCKSIQSSHLTIHDASSESQFWKFQNIS
jgi:hypothetical protein